MPDDQQFCDVVGDLADPLPDQVGRAQVERLHVLHGHGLATWQLQPQPLIGLPGARRGRTQHQLDAAICEHPPGLLGLLPPAGGQFAIEVGAGIVGLGLGVAHEEERPGHGSKLASPSTSWGGGYHQVTVDGGVHSVRELAPGSLVARLQTGLRDDVQQLGT